MGTRQVTSILIINAVLANTGDAALVQALVTLLGDKYPGAKVYIATHHHRELADLYPQWSLLPNFENAMFSFPNLLVQKLVNQLVKVLRWSNLFPWVLTHVPCISPSAREYLHIVRKVDIIISSPGGYLHDHYGISERLAVFKRIIHQNKSIYLIGQSIGPFWKKESIQAVQSIFPALQLYATRESYSVGHLLDILGREVSYFPDLAWTLPPPKSQIDTLAPKTIVVNVRPWGHDDVEIAQKFRSLCIYLLEKTDFDLLFLSTVQGFSFYRSDIDFFKGFFNQLPYQNRLRILDRHHCPNEYMVLVSSAHAYIGMRLHGAILSMISGVPAFHISYEDKGIGTYELLDFGNYCIPYSETENRWILAVDQFITDISSIKKMLPEKCRAMAIAAKKHLDPLPISNSIQNTES